MYTITSFIIFFHFIYYLFIVFHSSFFSFWNSYYLEVVCPELIDQAGFSYGVVE